MEGIDRINLLLIALNDLPLLVMPSAWCGARARTAR
jgi:hypothetical protein